ncbi:MAG: hypothetical protein IKQ39_07995 [Oscillospiraceae bacterium]|nr:hypothetical protein [Oscillospiraceae bacterium]
MNIFSRAYHRLFDGVPKILRLICWISLGFFVFIGLSLSLKAVAENRAGAADVIGYILIFALLGLFCVCFTGGLWQVLVCGSKRNLSQTLDQKLEAEGYGRSMADAVKNANMFPTTPEKLQQAFVWVMSEFYQEAEPMLLRINVNELNNREAAMYHTCRLVSYVMTGSYEKQIKLFTEKKAALDSAYQMKPNLTEKYVPYADDALAYFMLAGALMMHRGHADEAGKYEKLAGFQISQRSEPEMQFLPQIIKLNNLYAAGKAQAAHEKETELKGAVSASVMPAGTQRNLLRWIDQARIYSSLPIDKTEFLADRRLPEQGVQAAPPPPMDIPELF